MKPFHITATQLTQSLIVDEEELIVVRKDYRHNPMHQLPDDFDIIVECPRTEQTIAIFHYHDGDSMTNFLKDIVETLTEDWDW